jgi:hypothetical protein
MICKSKKSPGLSELSLCINSIFISFSLTLLITRLKVPCAKSCVQAEPGTSEPRTSAQCTVTGNPVLKQETE